MMVQPLFTFDVTPANADVAAILLRVVRLILWFAFRLDPAELLLTFDEDENGRPRVMLHFAPGHTEHGARESAAALSVEHYFLGLLQRVLWHAAARNAWPQDVPAWQPADRRCPGIVHLLSQQLFRGFRTTVVSGHELSIYDESGMPAQRIWLGHPLGLLADASYGVFTGQVQDVRQSSRRKKIIRLQNGTSRPRTLLVRSDLCCEDLVGRAALVLARPVRGRISFQVERIAFLQVPLF